MNNKPTTQLGHNKYLVMLFQLKLDYRLLQYLAQKLFFSNIENFQRIIEVEFFCTKDVGVAGEGSISSEDLDFNFHWDIINLCSRD